jgi:hypothetical protein
MQHDTGLLSLSLSLSVPIIETMNEKRRREEWPSVAQGSQIYTKSRHIVSKPSGGKGKGHLNYQNRYVCTSRRFTHTELLQIRWKTHHLPSVAAVYTHNGVTDLQGHFNWIGDWVGPRAGLDAMEK